VLAGVGLRGSTHLGVLVVPGDQPDDRRASQTAALVPSVVSARGIHRRQGASRHTSWARMQPQFRHIAFRLLLSLTALGPVSRAAASRSLARPPSAAPSSDRARVRLAAEWAIRTSTLRPARVCVRRRRRHDDRSSLLRRVADRTCDSRSRWAGIVGTWSGSSGRLAAHDREAPPVVRPAPARIAAGAAIPGRAPPGGDRFQA
jgi:hypothetical protein